MRPTLGSLPYTAVFTSGELATALATAAASCSCRRELTATSITWRVPSPLRTMSPASSVQTCCRAARNPGAALLPGPRSRELSSTTMSLVLWSPSTVDAVEGTARRPLQLALQLGGVARGIGDDERQHGGEVGLDHPRSLGDAEHAVAGRGLCAAQLGVGIGGHDGACHRQRGRRVEAGGQGGRGSSQSGHRQAASRSPRSRRAAVPPAAPPRAAPARSSKARAAATPSGAHTLATLLLIRMPRTGLPRWLRTISTGAPVTRLRVSTAAQARLAAGARIAARLIGSGTAPGAQLDGGEVGGGGREAESARDQGALLQGLADSRPPYCRAPAYLPPATL